VETAGSVVLVNRSCKRARNALISGRFCGDIMYACGHRVVQRETMPVECTQKPDQKNHSLGGHFVGGELDVAEMPGPASG
jgi:hypothetical protein